MYWEQFVLSSCPIYNSQSVTPEQSGQATHKKCNDQSSTSSKLEPRSIWTLAFLQNEGVSVSVFASTCADQVKFRDGSIFAIASLLPRPWSLKTSSNVDENISSTRSRVLDARLPDQIFSHQNCFKPTAPCLFFSTRSRIQAHHIISPERTLTGMTGADPPRGSKPLGF